MDNEHDRMTGIEPLNAMARRPGPIEAFAFVLYLPAALTSLLIVWATASLASEATNRGHPVTVGLVALGAYGLGAVFLVTAPGQIVVEWMTHQRQPNDYERSRLAPVWDRLCARVGVGPNRFTLRVEDSDEVNAFAVGTRSVAVTRDAVTLEPLNLEAILAHEIGHHSRWHGVIGLIGWYATGPTRILANVFVWLMDFVWRSRWRSGGLCLRWEPGRHRCRGSPVRALLHDRPHTAGAPAACPRS